MPSLPVVLGSASKWRRQLLHEAGVDFTMMSADIDESVYQHDDPATLVEIIALAKAEALLPQLSQPAILITCDQVVVCDGEIRGKPKDADEVRRYVHSYNQHPAETYTAVVVTHSETLQQEKFVDVAKVYFSTFSDNVIEKIIQQGQVFHCAGGFQIEGDEYFKPHITGFDGSLDSIQGLPVAMTLSAIRSLQL